MKLPVNKWFWIVLLLGIVVLASPQILRYYTVGNVLIGEEPYYFLRLADFIHEFKEIPEYDDLSYGGRYISIEIGWPLFLSLSPQLLSMLLPFLFGIGSLILFYLILTKLNQDIAFLSSVLLLLSPPFIYLSTVSTQFAVPIFLSLLGFYFLIKKNYILSTGFFILISFFSVLASFLVLLLFLIYSLKEKIKLRWFFIMLGSLALSVLIQFFNLFYYFGFPELLQFVYKQTGIKFLFQKLIFEIGGVYGFGFFLIILSLIGLHNFWKKKYTYLYYYFILALLSVLAIYFDFIIFYLNFALVIFAAYGIIGLFKRNWESKLIMKLVFIVFILGLFSGTLFYVPFLASYKPNKETFDAYYYLSRKPDEEVVFSHYSRGFWILGAEKTNVMDSNFFYAPEVNERYYDSEKLLNGQDINEAIRLIKKYNIKYIWIDKWLKDELWGGENKGLLYLIKYSDGFKLLFSNDSVEVYKVLY